MLRDFLRREDGAVTTEWVVLTAGVAALAAGVGMFLNENLAVILSERLEQIIANAVDAVGPVNQGSHANQP